MADRQWDEAGKTWDDDHGLLEPEQIAMCGPADTAESFRAPVPTRMVSNGEYMPEMQTEKQRLVQSRIDELDILAANAVIATVCVTNTPPL